MRKSSTAAWIGIGALTLVLLGFAATTAVGMVRSYSPVPTWDLWRGSFDFTRKAHDGFLAALWEPHNEHRIVLTKLLFWFDNTFLAGDLAPLIVVNAILAVTLGAVLAVLAWRMFPTSRETRIVLALVAGIVGVSWIHAENLNYAFQSQFFFTPIFSTAAFILAARAKQREDSLWRYVAAWVCALLAMISMGSGAPTPILLLLLLLVLRAPRKVLLGSGLVLVVALALYLHNLPRTPIPPASGPLDFVARSVRYGLAFLGEPAAAATGSLLAAQVAGVVFLLLTALVLVRMVRPGPTTVMDWAAVALVFFTVANMATSSLLRSVMGDAAPLASRYEVVVASGWFALLAVLVSLWVGAGHRPLPAAWLVAALVVVTLGAAQLSSLTSPNEKGQPPVGNTAARLRGAMSIELGVRDIRAEVPLLFLDPVMADWDRLSAYGRDQRLAVFGGRLAGLRDLLGKRSDGFTPIPCEVTGLTTTAVPDRPDWSRVTARTYAPGGEDVQLVEFHDSSGTIVGFATTGFYDADAEAAHGYAARFGGTQGYVLTSALPDVTAVCARR